MERGEGGVEGGAVKESAAAANVAVRVRPPVGGRSLVLRITVQKEGGRARWYLFGQHTQQPLPDLA